MANNRTVNLLPQIFQTDTNKKFLNATLDQLVSTPDFVKVNGYIGRRFAPTTKGTDSYVQESNALRQNYQLEPSVVVKNKSGETEFFGNYIDLLQQIEYYGGNISNHDRLFNNTSYSYNGLFDFDKFVNFNQYYWLPNGPDVVPVLSTGVPITDRITVTRDVTTGAYKFSSHAGALNPDLILAYGGTYEFVVNQPGVPFWIQIEQGTSGYRLNQPNTSSREILGVVNNGIDVGTIRFSVPLPNAQDNFNQLEWAYDVDIAVDAPYSSIQGQSVEDVLAAGLFDNISTSSLVNKRVIFVGAGTVEDDAFWTPANIFDAEPVPRADRFTVWTINLVDDGQGGKTINLVAPMPITNLQKVFVRSGLLHANTEYRINSLGYWARIPLISASALYLYYQDAVLGQLTGRIKLIETSGSVIDVEQEILGKPYFKSPNDIVFTNGLKISFDVNVVPSSYAEKEYYVEGVGSSISLVPVAQIFTVGNYIEDVNRPDYITINRASLDRNAWSRTNHWFHVDVINATARYLNVLSNIDQKQRAQRSIIEFDPSLQLFNNGQVAKDYVDILELNLITNAFLQIEGFVAEEPTLAVIPIGTKSLTLVPGDRIIFGLDTDPLIRNKIFNVNIVDRNENPISPWYFVHLTEANDSEIVAGNTVWASKVYTPASESTNAEYWFDGSTWIEAQKKTGYNQSPLFDIFTATNTSISERSGSTFRGTKVFSYKTGTGTKDPVLGFPLSYRNFQNVGDIQFSNDFDNDTYQYLIDRTTNLEPINRYFIRQNTGISTHTSRNVWTENKELTKQYQFFNYTFTGETNYFVIDIEPDTSYGSPNIVIYKNDGKITDTIDPANFSIVTVNSKRAVRVNVNILAVGDIITIKVYSKSVSSIGSYEIPESLDLNSLNNTFTTLTLGQIRNHLVTLSHNSTLVLGTVPGISNIRDLTIKDNSGSILQHGSPAIYSNLFLLDKNINFIKSIEYAQKEYTKFKNKFLELALTSGLVDTNDIPTSVDNLLAEINRVKNSKFPWYYSDMVPYGSNIQPLAPYQILNPEIRQYEIVTIFNDTELSDRAVSVYYAVTKKDAYGELVLDRKNQPIIVETYSLVKGQDYYFNQDRPAVTLTDNVALIYNDLIVIKDYISTNGSYIPETPTKLGLHPKFTPSIYTDNTYVTPILVIQGHDGSITPAFNDYRDRLLLELELRIYNNIKVSYNDTLIDINNFIPGKFRQTEYSLTEFNSILSTAFLKWVGTNRIDYTTNKTFSANNAFTWNYKNFTSVIDNSRLPGSWRAIFKYYYDTDRPHTHPWEMLAFSEKPSWWENRYGVAPYTGGNLVLWTDLSQGYIYGEDRYDPQYARPDLLRIIPVDDSGILRSPEQFIVSNFNGLKTNASFAIGDIGPAENAWRRSSDYAFSLQQAMALMKPGFYFGTLMNVDNYNVNTDINQLTLFDTLQRVSPTQVKINGIVSGVRQRTTGYVNWVGDYLTSLGIDPGVKIIEYLKNLSVQLSYKVAGFTGKNYLKILAEQSSPTSTNQSIIVPDNNYEIFLNKSTPVKKINYSAVIVQRSGAGWTVSGYDTENPYFTIIPSLANNNAARIEVGTAVGIIYQDFQNYKMRIPYGYEFNTRQQVVDFLISYGRFLIGQGMQFSLYNPDLNTPQDWTLSSREFLSWSQQGWRSGSLLVLSPIIDQINVTTVTGTVDYIENSNYGSKILDQDNNVIKNTQFTVVRYGNDFKLKANAGQTIAFAQLNVVQYEHAIIFDNTTLFNDIIYLPELGNRQFRLKIIGNRTGAWTGKLDIPGFIYNTGTVDAWVANTDYRKGSLVTFKNKFYIALANVIGTTDFTNSQWKQIPESQIKTGLLNNFSYNAQGFDNIYDINNQPQDEQINKFSNGLIGFRERSYLTDLGLDVETQSKFYQGYIKQKGTRNAVDALNQVSLNNIASDITTYEEWAVRVGEYGAIDSNNYLEIILDEQTFNSDPETFLLLDSGETAPDQIIGIKSEDLYFRPNNYDTNLLTYQTAPKDIAIPITAGYVNLSDVDATLYDIQNYTNLNSFLDKIGSGYKIWVAKDFTGDWNVYRVSETDTYVTGISYALNSLALISTFDPHNFAVGDVIAIKGFDIDFDGFYRVFELADNNTFYVVAARNAALLQSLESVTGAGLLFKLAELRANTSSAIVELEPLNNWRVGDTVWADNDQGEGIWSVYKKFDSWPAAGNIQLSNSNYQSDSRYGTSVKLTKNAAMAIVGSPSANVGSPQGHASVFYKDQGNLYVQHSTIQPTVTSALSTNINFGTTVDIGSQVLAIGAPKAQSDRGAVFLYNYGRYEDPSYIQILSPPEITIGDGSRAGDLFGTSISLSHDDRWLYVGSPSEGQGNVYVYEYTDAGQAITNVGNLVLGKPYAITTVGTTDFTLLGSGDNTVGTTFIANATGNVFVNEIFVGKQYTISSVGTTNFIALGASSNSIGTTFIANNSGTSTANNFVSGRSYTITLQGNTDFTTIGSAPSAVFTANINQNVMRVYTITSGSISEYCTLTGGTIVPGTYVVYQINGTPGGAGDYQISANLVSANTIIQSQPVVGTTFTANAAGTGTGKATQGTGSVIQGTGVVNGKMYEDIYTTQTTGVTDLVYKLHSTLENIESISITAGSKVFAGNIDYTYNNSTDEITFLADPGWPLKITVKSLPYYKLRTKIAPPTINGVTYSNWGGAIKTTTDGRQLVVGDSKATVNGLSQAGVATVHNRIIESFVGDGIINTYTTKRTLPAYKTVIVDGTYLVKNIDYVVNDNSIQFVTPPPRGKLVEIEINNFEFGAVLGLDEPKKFGNFGEAVDICNLNCSIYVGSPGYARPGYSSGRVYRYVNQARVYGSITGTKANPTVTVGDSIFINGIEVVFTDTTLESVVTNITRRAVPGIEYSITDGYLTLSASSTVPYKKLDLSNGVGTDPLGDLGIIVYPLTQAIEHPGSDTAQNFGSVVNISDTARTLFVSSKGATTRSADTWDSTDTTVDRESTTFDSRVKNAGTVYVYDYIDDINDSAATPSQFSFIKELAGDGVTEDANFGSSVTSANGVVLVGADRDSRAAPRAGEVYSFINSGSQAWQLVRSYSPKVDTSNLNRVFIYNKRTNEIAVNLDTFDPAKGKILGIADQELDYITSYDPAKYNQANPVLDTFQPQSADDASRTPFTFNSVGTTTSWGRAQVGQLWWNLDACRYIDYEQDSLTYRSKNWGALFPGSTIEICEWVESDVPPGSYTGSGTAKYPDNSTYSMEYNVDKSTGSIVTKYYFWVVNKTTSNPFAANKTRTAADIANIIENPQNAGVPYISAISSDAYNLYDINRYISGKDAVLHMDYSVVKNDNIIHSEYELIKENTASGIIPEKIINKLIDSLVGETVDYRRVPDPSLPANQKIGIGSRPMQSMFVNRYTALQNFVDYVNSVLIQHPVFLEFDTRKFYAQEPYPLESSREWDLKTDNYEDIGYIDVSLLPVGYRILITSDAQNDGLWTIYELDSDKNFTLRQVQRYRTQSYVNQVDWYDSSFNISQGIDRVVSALEEIETLTNLVNGDIVLVNNDGSGRYAYYRVNPDLTTTLVGLQNGTIQIDESIYDPITGSSSYDSGEFDTDRYDRTPSDEIRNIFEAIHQDIFVKTLDVEFNKMFFAIINYLLSEQKTTDWIFKTSFISVLHKIRKLDQYPSYIRDNQTYYEDYINEVKPYRTQIREYLLDYQGNDIFGGDITDFDLPAKYDKVTNTYRGPTLADIENPEFMASLPAELRAEYQTWYNNYKFQVSAIDVYNAGIGYIEVPSVSIVGGGGTGATAEAAIWQSNGSVRSITVTNPGSGYTGRPTVVINGSGSRDTGANIDLGVDVDGTIIYANIISKGSGFTTAPTIFIEGTGYGANVACTIDSKGTIASTIIVNGGFEYNENSVAKIIDPGTSAMATARINNVFYTPNSANSYNTSRSISSTIKFDRITYTSNIADWSANTTYYFGDTVRYAGQAYRANTTVYPSAILALASDVEYKTGDTIVTHNAGTVTGSANVAIEPSSITRQYRNQVTVGNILFVTNTQGILNGGLPYQIGQQTAYGTSPTYVFSNVNIISSTSVFDKTQYIEIPAGEFDNAADRTIGYYAPGVGMPARDLGQLYSGVDYPGVRVTGIKFDEKVSVTSNVIQFFSTNNTIYSNDVSQFNFSKSDLGAGQVIEVTGSNSNDQAWTINVVEDDRAVIYSTISGIDVIDEAAGNVITLTYYNENNPLSLDSSIESSYLDTGLGTRPEDINIIGGAYVDRFSSHAPEELVPGRLYDNLNMEVWTGMRSNTVPVGYRIYQGMNNDSTTQLTLELSEEITLTNTYPTATFITQVYLDPASPQANIRLFDGSLDQRTKLPDFVSKPYLEFAEQLFGVGGTTVTTKHLPLIDQYEHELNFYGFVVSDNRTIYVNGVDTEVTVTGVHKTAWPSYYTINPDNVTVLTSNLNLTDTEINVANAYALPQAGTGAALPGAIIINGEKIHYFRNYAREVVPWTPNTVYPTDAIVSYQGNVYVPVVEAINGNTISINGVDGISPSANIGKGRTAFDFINNGFTLSNITVANLYSQTFNFDNVEQFNVNRLTQIRRAVDGTGAPTVHAAGSRVVDTSEQQRLTGNVHLTTWLNYNNIYELFLQDNTGNTVTQTAGLAGIRPFVNFANLSLQEQSGIVDGSGLENSTSLIAKAIRRAGGLDRTPPGNN